MSFIKELFRVVLCLAVVLGVGMGAIVLYADIVEPSIADAPYWFKGFVGLLLALFASLGPGLLFWLYWGAIFGDD